jgi:hypothetical protein
MILHTDRFLLKKVEHRDVAICFMGNEINEYFLDSMLKIACGRKKNNLFKVFINITRQRRLRVVIQVINNRPPNSSKALLIR